MRSNPVVRYGWLLLLVPAAADLPQATAGARPALPSASAPAARAALPDLFARAALVHAELALIRDELGKPRITRPPLRVRGAAPRALLFQALTLFQKANRLSFEQTRVRTEAPSIPTRNIEHADVLVVVDAALARIRNVKQALGIPEEATPAAATETKTDTDLFGDIVDANRQLNLLLDQRWSPSDVYQQVTRAVGYGARLLARFPEVDRFPEAPPFERRKQPADVYRRLVNCFQRVRSIADVSGVEVLQLEPDEASIEAATPSDVYDVASLLVSELAFLHAQLGDEAPAPRAYYPGRKLPAHVYQRAGILETQLHDLARLVSENPSWLSGQD